MKSFVETVRSLFKSSRREFYYECERHEFERQREKIMSEALWRRVS